MSRITTHVLDTSRGRPAAGVGVTLERLTGGELWEVTGTGRTDDDGRLRTLLASAAPVTPGLIGLFSTPLRISAHTACPSSTPTSPSPSPLSRARRTTTCLCS